jgi:predicted ATP-binding protein involved in virulence
VEQIFMTELSIPRVRHLRNISIPLSAEGRKHLILTGKNGRGKTSVLKAFSDHLEYLTSNHFEMKDEIETSISLFERELEKLSQSENRFSTKESYQKTLSAKKQQLKTWTEGAHGHYTSIPLLREKYRNGRYVIAYYGDTRNLEVAISSNIEKIELQSIYALHAHPGKDFVKYLVNQKTRQAFA